MYIFIVTSNLSHEKKLSTLHILNAFLSVKYGGKVYKETDKYLLWNNPDLNLNENVIRQALGIFQQQFEYINNIVIEDIDCEFLEEFVDNIPLFSKDPNRYTLDFAPFFRPFH